MNTCISTCKVEITIPTTNRTTVSEVLDEKFACNKSSTRSVSNIDWFIAKSYVASDIVQIFDNIAQSYNTNDDGLLETMRLLYMNFKRIVNT